MHVFKSINELHAIDNPVVSIGTFDGVHLGHRIILNRLNHEAKRLHGESLLITFWPHPRMVLQPDYKDLRLLNTMEEKLELLEQAGLQNLLVIPFTHEFSRTTSHDFIRTILVERVKMKKIIIGYDHHFGRNREGSFDVLKEFQPIFNFELEEISAQQIDEINVSSTKIRQALFEGDVQRSREFLGYYYFLNGTVVKGHSMGKTLGFPTANIKVNYPFKLIPKDGVYAVNFYLRNKKLKGMLNIGYRPTFNGEEKSVEVHLFDFDGDIYAEDVKLEFVERIRDEKKFAGKDALIAQLKEDEQRVRALFDSAR
ncbi:bifunctional riboflavin kinase/FAD synthetase [bacterium]|nr:bifunctional riboflavin kinase/FAD synthetase [bacterium]